MAKKLFSGADFDKTISIGDQLVFDKPDLKTIRIDLTWKGTDLDVCAFLLGDDDMIHNIPDLVYFNSKLRWKTEKPFNDPDFNPLKGEFDKWEDEKEKGTFKNPRKWMEATLPVSQDGSVIGSWDDMDEPGEEDDKNKECGETMHVRLDEVDTRKYASIVFAAAVAKDKIEKGESFKDAIDPVVSIYDADTDELLVEYKLDQEFPDKDVVRFGRVIYDENTYLWTFEPLAIGDNGGMMYLATEVYN